MRGPPVVLTNTLGRPVTNVISERGAVPMTVVNTLGEPVTLVASGGEPVTLFNANGTLWDYPFSLFANNEQGAWYDPSDFSTLFQNSTGTTPVTAVEQPVRLMLDRSGRGNHATAPNDASRPVLRSRYNLLTYTEDFSNAIWSKNNATVVANQYVDSQGTSTLDRVLPTAGNATHYLQYTITYTATQHTLSFEARYDNHRWIAVTTWDGTTNRNASFDLLNGVVGVTSGGATSSITSLGSGLYRCVVTFTPLGVLGNFTIGPNDIDSASIRTWNAAGTEAFGLGRAQLLTSADQTSTGGAYQRIAAATDYDTSNPVWRPYLAFDGSDDSFSTSSIDFSGTDEMTVFAGVTKLSDAAIGLVAELSADKNSNAGSFYLAASEDTGANGTFSASFRGSVNATRVFSSVIPAPATRVMTALGDISADSQVLRLNGTQVATSSSDQGTGNFGNYPLFIGRRNNASLPFNGRLTSLIVLGRTATAAEISATESWVNGKTGAY